MRVLLASSASYDPPRGGSTRGNLAWLRYLASAGHECIVFCGSATNVDAITKRDGIEIRSFHNLLTRTGQLRASILDAKPDWVLVSSEDLSHTLLREAGSAALDRLAYLAHTPQFFPFGPESWNRDERATAIVQQARAVVAIGRHMAGYIEQHTGVQAHVIHPPIYGSGPWPDFAKTDSGEILLVNPCAVKGISIFRALAESCPSYDFAALAGWGTTAADRASLAALRNVRILESVEHIDQALSRARLLLLPSLWHEGFGMIAIEAMLRGLPVVASDSGGLREAKQGTGFTVPVRPIARYLAEFDEVHMPKPVLEEQDLRPWKNALDVLLGDAGIYSAESHRSRNAASQFVAGLHAGDFEEMLKGVQRGDASANPRPTVDSLSPARRALLAKLIREKGKV